MAKNGRFYGILTYFWPFFIDCRHIYVPNGKLWGSTSKAHIRDLAMGVFILWGPSSWLGITQKKVNFLCRPFFGNVQMSIFFTITLCSTCWYLKMHLRRVGRESLERLNVLVLVQLPSGSVLFFFCSNSFLDRCGYFHVRFFYSSKNMLCWLPSWLNQMIQISHE